MLDNFYAKVNKATLDKIGCIESRKKLHQENANLKIILKQYLDGTTINEDAIDQANPLLVINDRGSFADKRVRRSAPVIIDGNEVVSSYARQRHRS